MTKNFNEVLDFIDTLMDKMKEKEVSSVKVKVGEMSVELSNNSGVQTMVQAPVMQAPQAVAPVVSAVESVPSVPSGNIVKAPIIGTFYSAPSPNDKPFVTVGQKVKEGDILFIIESMKVMNEVKSEFSGTVDIINVKDGEAVEYDQPVMIIS